LKPPDQENPFWPMHFGVRAYGRDLIRAKGIMASGDDKAASQAEHMAAPTSRRGSPKKPLANGEPSTHGQFALWSHLIAIAYPQSAGWKNCSRQLNSGRSVESKRKNPNH
jgi:hypothetical protein